MAAHVIAVDSGKYATKLSMLNVNNQLVHKQFKTQMDEGGEKVDESDKQTFAVEYEGKKYLLGFSARTQSFKTSKEEEIHKIATYVAVSNAVGNGDSVVLAIGCPLKQYLNKAERERYKNFIAPQGKQIDITVDKKHKTFTIAKSFVYPESSGVIYLNRDKYKDDIVGVVDIGGLNINVCVYDHLIPIVGPDTIFTLELGGNMLISDTMTKVNQECGIQVQSYAYENWFMKGYVNNAREKSSEIIANMRQEHIKKILHECGRHNVTSDSLTLVFTGGTAACLKKEIMAADPNADVSNLDNNPEYKNADGFLYQTLKTLGYNIEF